MVEMQREDGKKAMVHEDMVSHYVNGGYIELYVENN